jgi:hypothetical protein
MARDLSIHLEERAGIQCIVPNDPTKVWVTPATIHEQELFAYVEELEEQLEQLSQRERARRAAAPKPAPPKVKPDITFITLPGMEGALDKPDVPRPNGPHGPRVSGKWDLSSPEYLEHKRRVSEYFASLQDESIKGASKRGEHWSALEDQLVMDYSYTAYQLAELLDRTFYAVVGRRSLLKRLAKQNGVTP